MESLLTYPDWSDKTLLIAEDYDSNYTVLAALLKKTNVRILRAHNGEEAVKMVTEQDQIDLILMDISMPDVDGVEALQLIKQQFPGKIVIAQTAHDLSSGSIRESFDDFLLKPIRRKKLLETLSKYLS